MTVIIVIEPHPVLRFGLSQILSEAIAYATVEGLDYDHLNQATVHEKQSDLVLLSILSTSQSAGQINAVKRIHSPQAILLLTDSTDINPTLYDEQSLVRGVVSNDATPELLQASVKLILAGGTCFPIRESRPRADKSLLSLYEPVKWPPKSSERPEMRTKTEEAQLLGLTPRQYEVLVLLARGYPLKTVGKHLNISVATAKAHTETLYQRLDVHNRNAAVYAAVARGATLGWSNIAAMRNQTGERKSI